MESIFATNETGVFEFAELYLNATGPLEFSWTNADTDVSYFYAYEAETVKMDGIRPAFIAQRARANPMLAECFHFHAPLGLLNEPNGFSRTNDGLYHLHYQHNPHNTQCESMHWGHAISTDLFNWVHQPIFLRPSTDKECAGNDCVWQSGSAVPLQNDDDSSEDNNAGLQIFMTNNFMTDNSTGNVSMQIQMTVRTNDTIQPSEQPIVIIEEMPVIPPELNITLSSNVNGPHVFLGPNGYHYMTLGSQDLNGKGGIILLYRTQTWSLQSAWDFKNVLWTDNTFGTTMCEHAALVPLGDPRTSGIQYALMYSRMDSVDIDLRKNLQTMVYGTFDGRTFQKIMEQNLDFAAGSYGYQAFYDPQADETLLIGWLGNSAELPDRHPNSHSGMTLPRIMKPSWRYDRLLVAPHPNVFKMLDIELDGQALERGNVVPLPRGTAYIKLVIDYNYFYNGIFVRINHAGYLQLGVRVTRAAGLELVKVNEADPPNRRYNVPSALPNIVHIFIDRDSLEIFGEFKMDVRPGMSRYVGTTRLTGGSNGTFAHSVQLETSDRYLYVLNGCQIWSMKRAEMRGVLHDEDNE